MNILYLTNHLNVGGVTSYVLTLSKGLRERGHNVYVASSAGELLPKFIEGQIGYFPIPIKTKLEVGPKVLMSLFRLLPYIKEKNIDIIHSNTRVTQVLACLAGYFSKKTFVSTCHGFFKKRFSRRIFPCWGEKVIAISKEVKEHLMVDFKVREKNIAVVRNGVDIERFREPRTENRQSRKKALGLGSGPVVSIIARLSDIKGHIYLIEAWVEVLKNIPEAQLLIVGEGKMEDELLSLVSRLKIEKSVFFVPTIKDTLEVLAATDLFILPSLEEGLGLSLMEAMASGVAVIGSDVGGIKSLIQDGYTGLLVKPKDIAGISCAISALLKDPEKRKFLGDNARNFIAENFSSEQMIFLTEEVYRECLSLKD